MKHPNTPHLVLRTGPDQGQSHPIEKSPFVIGADPHSDLSVSARFVAPRHAVIERDDDGRWFILNQNINGTLVNQIPIERHALKNGDIIQVGEDLLLEYQFSDPSAPAQPDATAPAPATPDSSPGSFLRRPGVIIGLLLFYLLIGAGAIFLWQKARSSANGSDLTREKVEQALQETRGALSDDGDDPCGTTTGPPTSTLPPETSADPAAAYYAILSLRQKLGHGDSAITAATDDLLRRIEDRLFKAWLQESREHWERAMTEYRSILDLLPNLHCPVAQLAAERITLLEKRNQP